MFSWVIAYATTLFNAYRVYQLWFPAYNIPRQECDKWASGIDGVNGDLCIKWSQYYMYNLPNGAYSDFYRYGEKCRATGRVAVMSDLATDFTVFECIDACPDGRSDCNIGRLAEQERARRVKKNGFLSWRADTPKVL